MIIRIITILFAFYLLFWLCFCYIFAFKELLFIMDFVVKLVVLNALLVITGFVVNIVIFNELLVVIGSAIIGFVVLICVFN